MPLDLESPELAFQRLGDIRCRDARCPAVKRFVHGVYTSRIIIVVDGVQELEDRARQVRFGNAGKQRVQPQIVAPADPPAKQEVDLFGEVNPERVTSFYRRIT